MSYACLSDIIFLFQASCDDVAQGFVSKVNEDSLVTRLLLCKNSCDMVKALLPCLLAEGNPGNGVILVPSQIQGGILPKKSGERQLKMRCNPF